MKKILQVALGILAAIGGFVDIGDLVFNTQAGARFGFDLAWAVVVGVIGIVVYAEMCGRVAAVTKRPVMGVVRQRLGFGPGLVTMVASQVVNLMTLAAEVGGLALVLQLLFDISYSGLILIAIAGLMIVVWRAPFQWIERVFGYGGLLMLVFIVSAIHLDPDWGRVASGFAPEGKASSDYWFFVVGLIAAALMPYEVYFYSSGAIEERWTKKDLGLNKANAILGFGLGGLLSIGIMITSAQVFQAGGVDPELIGSTALGPEVAFGEVGLLLALGGILLAVGGAAIDASFSGAYNLAQFMGWEWGKYRGNAEAPRFTFAWMGMFLLAFVVISTGIDPIQLTEYSVIFSVVILPLTYLPVLLIARDRTFMGEHANGPISSFFGWLYLAIICLVSVAAIPLLLATST